MKRKLSIILLAAVAIASIFAFSSCSNKSEIPSGMQLVAGGKADGYYFYAPEEWTVSNIGEIKSAYASRVDTTSVSFCEIDVKSMIPSEINASEYFFTSYFNDGLSEYPESAKMEVTLDAETAVFGKKGEDADKAIKYTYNYEYSEHKFGFMQILMQENDRFFVFTYCALLEERSDDKTFYEYYLEKIQTVIDEFRFIEVTEEKEEIEYKKDKDGYILVTNKDLAGFDLYVPDAFRPEYSSAIVSTTHSDGSNINMTEAMMTGNLTVEGYFKYRKEELSAFVTDFTEIETFKTISFGNADSAYSYEYTFVYNGEKYHIYQVFVIEGPILLQDGYVFTYTAKEANYSLHYDEIQTVIEKVNFK